ncbi:hypothetical protein [Polaromonas sp. JS666]|uniref:hypothetical protein n=1 Tax=Polaromonas sp. (strain JS666 / ATCC BAA-500) TaxID=296591 RepID=UPI00004646AD|nr:hypothetical protein [Polaromonas sp. JS666]ABE47174.1 transposase [Polaromonas sp. JS666]
MALKISKGVVAKYVSLANAAGLDWGEIKPMTEAHLQARLLPGNGGDGRFIQPDFAQVHRELARKGMTLMLLWQEYQASHPAQRTNQYSQYGSVAISVNDNPAHA